MNKIFVLFMPLALIAPSTFARIPVHDSLVQLQQAYIQMHEEMQLMHDRLENYYNTLSDQANDDEQNNAENITNEEPTKWFSYASGTDLEDAIEFVFEDVNTDNLEAVAVNDNEMIVAVDYGSVHLVAEDGILWITVTRESGEELDNGDDTVTQTVSSSFVTKNMPFSGILASFEQASIVYEKSSTKQLIITLPKQVISGRKISVNIA
jgi:hypothetical protein